MLCLSRSFLPLALPPRSGLRSLHCTRSSAETCYCPTTAVIHALRPAPSPRFSAVLRSMGQLMQFFFRTFAGRTEPGTVRSRAHCATACYLAAAATSCVDTGASF